MLSLKLRFKFNLSLRIIGDVYGLFFSPSFLFLWVRFRLFYVTRGSYRRRHLKTLHWRVCCNKITQVFIVCYSSFIWEWNCKIHNYINNTQQRWMCNKYSSRIEQRFKHITRLYKHKYYNVQVLRWLNVNMIIMISVFAEC